MKALCVVALLVVGVASEVNVQGAGHLKQGGAAGPQYGEPPQYTGADARSSDSFSDLGSATFSDPASAAVLDSYQGPQSPWAVEWDTQQQAYQAPTNYASAPPFPQAPAPVYPPQPPPGYPPFPSSPKGGGLFPYFDFGSSLLSVGVAVVVGLLGFSLLLQLFTRLVGSTQFADLANLVGQGRSLDSETIEMYTDLALNGIEKLRNLYEEYQ